MISVTLQGVRSAKASEHDAGSWVTLVFSDGSRAAIHTRTFAQAERIAAVFMETVGEQDKPHAGAGAREEVRS